MSNFICGSCGANWLDMDAMGFKTDKQVEAENLWHAALAENNRMEFLILDYKQEIKRLKALLKKRNAKIRDLNSRIAYKDGQIGALKSAGWTPQCEPFEYPEVK